MEKNIRFGLRLDQDSKRNLCMLAKETKKSGSLVIRELVNLATRYPSLLSSNQSTNDGQTH